ncbi:TonB-dependent receptor [Methylosinus sp. RM1]|uniref:TonB-dependent receptor n=1 Tax=Methylosinus sp. RM1 TaxID=2583817 RepID=UPI00140D5998|nr:TonB-dependent receptor [Methylosinus sp. RM1]
MACGGSAAAQTAPAPIPDPVVGQTGAAAVSAQVDDVTVTARNREEKAQDVPLPVSVVGPKAAGRERLERLSDFAEKVPNYRPNISNPRTSGTAIRGVAGGTGASSGGADGSEASVGYIVDDVFYTHVGFQWQDFVDLQSFEVARGPQGTLLGKNTTVGAVVIRTQLPAFTRSATIESSFANYNRFIEKLNVTGPIIDDKLAYRVTFYLDKGDGWIRDAVTGASYLNNDRWGVRGQLYYVGDEITNRLIFDRSASHEYNNSGSGVIGDSVPLFANGTLGASYATTLAKRLGKPILTYDPYTRFQTRVGTLDQRTIGVSDTFTWSLGENTLTSISAWREFRLHPRNSLGEQLTEITSNAYDVSVDQFSQEIRFTSPKEQTFEWQTGLYSLYERVWSLNHFDFGSDAGRWFNSGSSATAVAQRNSLLNGFKNHRDGKATTFSVAAFGQGTYHIDEQWALTFGLRDTYEIREGSVFAWEEAWGEGLNPFVVDAAIRGGGGVGFYDTGAVKKYFNSLSGLFNPSYRYNENVLVYGSVARGEKSGAINTDAQPILDDKGNFKQFQPVITKPEVSWDYELGVKTNWLDNRLIVNANVYWNDIFNYQAQLVNTDYRDSTGQVLRRNYLGNIGHVRLRGIELDARWSPVERLWLTLNGAYAEARYINFDKSPPPADWLWPTVAGQPAAPASLNRDNSRFENFPLWSFNAGANYELPLGNLFADVGGWANRPVTGILYANLSWRDKQRLTNPYSVFQYWQPAYALVNAGAGLRADDESWQLMFWTKNLFDQRYVTAWSPGSVTTAATVTLQAQPRTFGGTLTVKLY